MQAAIQKVYGKVNDPDDPNYRQPTIQFLINIFDDDGNPTNGNYITVYYQQYANGNPVGGIQSVQIAGLSVSIYYAIAPTDGPNFIITSVTPPPITPPPPTTPDLKIVSIEITQKADSAGLNGKVNINATSSFLPILYYIDDVLQSGSQNLTVTSGPHVAKVTDAIDTEVTQPFTVLKLDSILYKDPSKTVDGLVSRWNAAFNPIVFEYHRKDFDVTGIAQDSATLKPKIVVNTDISGIALNDYVYLNAGLTNGLSTYLGAYQVINKIGTNTLVIDTDYVAPDSISGFMNSDTLKPYYKVITKIKYVDPGTGRFNTIISTNRPINSITKADLSSFLQSILNPQPDQSDYTQINYRDMGLAASYQISYGEAWENNDPEYTNVETPYYVTDAAMQLQQAGGGNMFDYVTQPGGVQLAKWLTDFNEPSYSTSFPFDVSFIYSEQIAGRQLYYKIILLDINRQPLGTNAYTSFLLNEDGSYLLNNDGSKLIIARQQLVNTPIVEHVGLNRLLIGQDFGPDCYYLNLQLFYDEDTTHIPVTQPIIVKIDKVCANNWVYLRWIGLTGSWNYFRFNYNQTKTLDIQNPVIIKDYVSDWENSEGIERVISKDAGPKTQLYADALSKDDIDGMRALKAGCRVQMLMSKSPIKWQTIVVNSSTFTEYDTQNEFYEFGITFSTPSLNLQSQ